MAEMSDFLTSGLSDPFSFRVSIVEVLTELLDVMASLQKLSWFPSRSWFEVPNAWSFAPRPREPASGQSWAWGRAEGVYSKRISSFSSLGGFRPRKFRMNITWNDMGLWRFLRWIPKILLSGMRRLLSGWSIWGVPKGQHPSVGEPWQPSMGPFGKLHVHTWSKHVDSVDIFQISGETNIYDWRKMNCRILFVFEQMCSMMLRGKLTCLETRTPTSYASLNIQHTDTRRAMFKGWVKI